MRALYQLLLLAVVVSVGPLALAETAVVERNVNLRTDPSTAHPPVTVLTAGTPLELIEPAPRAGFLHVRTADGKQGWAFAQNIRTEGARAAAAPVSSRFSFPRRLAAARSRSASGPCSAKLEDCDPNGCEPLGTAHALANQGKRNVPPPGPAIHLSFEHLGLLQQAADDLGVRQGQASHLTKKDRDKLKHLDIGSGGPVGEGDLVAVAGFIAAEHDIKASSGESVNCRLPGEPNNDIHLPVVARPDDSEYHSVVVEPIPQGTKGGNAPNRPAAWSAGTFRQIQADGRLLLFRGQLFFDNQHRVRDNPDEELDDPGLTKQPKRFTLWEVHPVTEILLCTRPENDCDPAASDQWSSLK